MERQGRVPGQWPGAAGREGEPQEAVCMLKHHEDPTKEDPPSEYRKYRVVSSLLNCMTKDLLQEGNSPACLIAYPGAVLQNSTEIHIKDFKID